MASTAKRFCILAWGQSRLSAAKADATPGHVRLRENTLKGLLYAEGSVGFLVMNREIFVGLDRM